MGARGLGPPSVEVPVGMNWPGMASYEQGLSSLIDLPLVISSSVKQGYIKLDEGRRSLLLDKEGKADC